MQSKEVKENVKATETKVKEAAKATTKAAETKVKEAAKDTAKAAETKVKEAAKTTAKKAAAVEPQVIIQYQNNESDLAKVTERVKTQFVSEGHKAGIIKKINVYLKPEEYSAYYVINDKFSGRVDLF